MTERDACTPDAPLPPDIALDADDAGAPEAGLADGGLADAGLVDLTREYAAAAMRQARLDAAEAEPWLYFRIGVAAGDGNRTVAARIAPRLNGDDARGAIRSWWWLNKADRLGSAVRLRILLRREDRAAARDAVIARVREGVVTPLSVLRYEPELCLFGGPAGMSIAHTHFAEDSRFLVNWMRDGDPARTPTLPDGVTAALSLRLLQASGLDLFETWDVFARVLDKRRPWAGPAALVERYRTMARDILRAGTDAVFRLYPGAQRTHLDTYRAALTDIGSSLSRTYSEGRLECGLRELLAPVILFQWNRAGLSGRRQGALAQAMVDELRHLARDTAHTWD